MFWHPSIFRKTPETTPKTHVEGKVWPQRGSLAPVDLSPNDVHEGTAKLTAQDEKVCLKDSKKLK